MATVPGSRPLLRTALVTVPAIVVLGFLSGWLSNSGFGNGWYEPLVKPSFQPPAIAFPIVWTTLYVLMGISLAIVLTLPPSAERRRGLALFAAQLVLNLAWSPIFFGAGAIDWGLLVILAMDVLVTATIVSFVRLRPLAGLLLLPYLAWLCLATALNHETGRLNPGADRAPLGLTGA
ncbi:tryptophan-rich sensory protein [Sphingomonas ginkgonis]|uniref:Tryptophan-rich sensory protein n=1 Tax=Sphingomonas ginkgonis TaxID=2315330 RepID=A0A429V9T5_9SPHN|nr:TspO/MBR family protein [Sphingomonas ginkgonis]RST30607.1 tryptophan-rich sensory protein [Sphingomonas ginkgonis]